MENAVVSDRLETLLADRQIKAAVFTTYNFEPDFFELEVIPLLLPGNTQLSSHASIKQFQVREALRESAVELEVFYDLRIFRENANCSPAMEYPFHGVYRGNNAFHPKLAFILVYDEKTQSDCLLVGAGSNNLTQAGWWDNIEGVHWEMVWPRSTDSGFIEHLQADMKWLQNERYLVSNDRSSALDLVAEHLKLCLENARATSTTGMKVPYYGIADSDSRSFQAFLESEVSPKLSTDNNWTLEIISPYFAEDAHNNLHEPFFDLGVRQIHLLLPTNQEGVPVCTPEYFNYIEEQPNIYWAQWLDPVGRSLGLTGQHFRRLHAKLYHFYNKKQSWVFVGSVNFTHKAFSANIEAGYFIQLPKAEPLLNTIEDAQSFDSFAPPSEPAPGNAEISASESLPIIDLLYDWRTRTLTGATEKCKRYCINIHRPEGDLAVSEWTLRGRNRCEYEGDLAALEILLKNGSLVKVSGVNQRSNKAFDAHWIMMKQTGWSHKPLDLPEMSPEQILAIYAGMSPDKRQALLMNAHIRKLVLSGQGGDMTLPDDFVAREFFSEYAELFHAFRQLQRKLLAAREDDNKALVEYYLTGAGFDSLPTLRDSIMDDEENRSVKAYLILLCAKEVYQADQLSEYFHVPECLRQVESAISELKENGSIVLEKNTPEDRTRFFSWFESQFLKAYRQQEVAE